MAEVVLAQFESPSGFEAATQLARTEDFGRMGASSSDSEGSTHSSKYQLEESHLREYCSQLRKNTRWGNITEIDWNIPFRCMASSLRPTPSAGATRHALIADWAVQRLGLTKSERANEEILLWFEDIGGFSDRDFGLIAHTPTPSTDPLDIGGRIDQLRVLEDGWLEAGGLAPPKDGLDWFLEAFNRYYPSDLPLPYLYPTEDGGLQAEWDQGGREANLKIDLISHFADWRWFEADLNDEAASNDHPRLNLEEIKSWDWIAEEIRGTGAHLG